MKGDPFVAIVMGILFGFLGRFYMLKVDYRQYPSYPHGYVTHLTFGLIAAALGSLFLPALLTKDFVAVTFLSLAAQQFREIRKVERESLEIIENTELIPRGSGYIEGIAKLFEARNYLAMSIALVITASTFLTGPIPTIPIGLIAIYVANRIVVGEKVGDIAVVRKDKIIFEGPNIGIGKEIIMNIGEQEALEVWKTHGLAFSIEPKDDNARITLSNKGQRQAILHDVSSQLGAKVDVGIQHFQPIIRVELATGRLLMLIVPNEPDAEPLIKAIEDTPLLETASKKPLKRTAGRAAAD